MNLTCEQLQSEFLRVDLWVTVVVCGTHDTLTCGTVIIAMGSPGWNGDPRSVQLCITHLRGIVFQFDLLLQWSHRLRYWIDLNMQPFSWIKDQLNPPPAEPVEEKKWSTSILWVVDLFGGRTIRPPTASPGLRTTVMPFVLGPPSECAMRTVVTTVVFSVPPLWASILVQHFGSSFWFIHRHPTVYSDGNGVCLWMFASCYLMGRVMCAPGAVVRVVKTSDSSVLKSIIGCRGLPRKRSVTAVSLPLPFLQISLWLTNVRLKVSRDWKVRCCCSMMVGDDLWRLLLVVYVKSHRLGKGEVCALAPVVWRSVPALLRPLCTAWCPSSDRVALVLLGVVLRSRHACL